MVSSGFHPFQRVPEPPYLNGRSAQEISVDARPGLLIEVFLGEDFEGIKALPQYGRAMSLPYRAHDQTLQLISPHMIPKVQFGKRR
jgi:hypothetical protein